MTRISLASDFSVLRSFKQEQKFWAIGQTVHLHIHFTPTDGAYAWISYYTRGKFKNQVTANANSPFTIPQQIEFTNNSEMRLKHISLGWKHYLSGSTDSESGLNLYNYLGFGLILGLVENEHSIGLDTSTYNLPVFGGRANFKRLTIDLGLGAEFPIGADVFVYLEARACIPTSGYPSQHILKNENAPFVGALNTGLRILF
jgi:hypothetical protein